MRLSGSASATFSASHIIEGHLRCGRLHGHLWRVEVTIEAGQDPKTGDLFGLSELAEAVEQLSAEIDREHINHMFPASPATPLGIALAFRERLAMNFTSIASVTVCADGVCSTVHA